VSGGKYGTNFVESEALLALTVEDETECERLLRDMLPGELAALTGQAQQLADMARSMLRIKSGKPAGRPGAALGFRFSDDGGAA
jgi:hypothetical protein